MMRLTWLTMLLVSCSADSKTSPSSQAASALSVGEACLPGDEVKTDFSGYAANEVSLELMAPSCQGGVCLVAHFQGRVSCPYGQAQGNGGCKTLNGEMDVTVPVKPQLQARRPEDAVHCSCRCAGENVTAEYCACPEGFSCQELSSIGSDVADSYCVRADAEVEDPRRIPPEECDLASQSCG